MTLTVHQRGKGGGTANELAPTIQASLFVGQAAGPMFSSCNWVLPIFQSVFQRSFRWYQTVQKNMYDLRIRLVFLQQLRQTQKDNILKPKLNNPLCSNYHPSDFVRNLLIVNLDVLDLF